MANKSLQSLLKSRPKSRQNLDDLLKEEQAQATVVAETAAAVEDRPSPREPVLEETPVTEETVKTVEVVEEIDTTPAELLDPSLIPITKEEKITISVPEPVKEVVEETDNTTTDTTEFVAVSSTTLQLEGKKDDTALLGAPVTNSVLLITEQSSTPTIDDLLSTPEEKAALETANADTETEVVEEETPKVESAPDTAPTSSSTSQLIAQLKNKKEQATADRSNLSAAFHSTSSKKTANPLKNFQLVIMATFGIGLLAFGLFQFIKNANLNFASENGEEATGLPTATTAANPAAPPQILSFQGRLASTESALLSPVQMTFSLYDTDGGATPPPTGGFQAWTSTLCYVDVDSTGFFAVSLGAGKGNNRDGNNCGANIGDVFSKFGNLWLQITVKEEVLFPRQLVKAVPYALNAAALGGYSASASATANTIPVVNSEGNLVLNTDNTAIINRGDLSLRSEQGDLFFLPGGGTIHLVGDASISGELVINDNFTIATDNNKTTIATSSGDLQLRSGASQDLSNVLALTSAGKVGIGTTAPTQKLTIANGNLGFEYLKAPVGDNFVATEDSVVPQGISPLAAPATSLALNALAGDGGELSLGNYSYAISYVTFDGSLYRETAPGALANITINEASTSVLLSNIPTYPTDNVVARKIYRTTANQADYKLVQTIEDNLTTSLIDTISDAKLTAQAKDTGDANTFRYKVTFVTKNGETNASAATPILALSGGSRAIKLNNIPIDKTGQATTRKVYRTLAGGATYHLVATIPDNSTATLYDTLADDNLRTHTLLADYNSTSGGLYAGDKKLIQLSDDGKIVTQGQLVAEGRVETSHGDNQGLQLPTSIGKPVVKIGQKVGDIVYDSVSSTLYIYNGKDFVPQFNLGGNVAPTATSTGDNLAVSGQNNSGCNGNNCQINIEPEYANAVITADGDNHDGDLIADHEVVNGNLHHNFYLWQSTVATIPQTVDILLSLTLPNDFTAWQSEALTLDYATQTTDSLNNNVEVTVYKNGGENITQNAVSMTADTWQSRQDGSTPLTISAATLDSLGFKAGDTVVIKITPASENNHYVKLGKLALNYTGNQGVTTAGGKSYWHKLAGALFTDPSTDQVFFGGENLDNAKIAMLGLSGSDPATLAVDGNIFLKGNHDNYLDIAAGNRFAIRAGEALKEALTILPNGNVGVNNTNPKATLDVGGTLSLAPMTAAEAGECNAETEGTIYYDIDQQGFFACTATDPSRSSFAWTPLMRTAP